MVDVESAEVTLVAGIQLKGEYFLVKFELKGKNRAIFIK